MAAGLYLLARDADRARFAMHVTVHDHIFVIPRSKIPLRSNASSRTQVNQFGAHIGAV
jgi:hypothetical protein